VIAKTRAALRAARDKLRALIKERHDAHVGGKRRKELAKQVRAARGEKDALAKKLKYLIEQRDAAPPQGDSIVQFDGKPCAAWIARDLQKIRDLGWDGFLLSGYRTPAYSTGLCIAICGAPTCPNRCAGATSNHSKYVEPEGAADLDPGHLAQALSLLRQIGSPLHNAIGPTDPNHVSASGR
jgi:hypothetical protein